MSKIATSPVERIGRYRWKICALLFFATSLNYMDRLVLALLKPTLQDPANGIGFTEVDFGFIVMVFSAAYALGSLVVGGFIDRVGAKKGYAAALGIWSIAAMGHTLVTFPTVIGHLHALVQALAHLLAYISGAGTSHWLASMGALSGAMVGFGIAEFVLGLGQSGNFPAAVRTVAGWFPEKERALATGIFTSGTNVGATVAPFVVAFVMYSFGWRWAFLSTSVFSATWLVFWLTIYHRPHVHPKVLPAEMNYIDSDPPEPPIKVPWARLLPHRQTWAFLAGKFMTDPVWWFYLYWLPGFLHDKFGLSISKQGLPLLIIYNMSAVGGISGGLLSARFLSRGWSVNRARKTAMLICACAAMPIMIVGRLHNAWLAVAVISLGTTVHMAWTANMFTLPSDMFPRRAVASIVGVGGAGGAVGMMLFGPFIGFVLEMTHGNYVPIFIVAGSAYLAALLLIHVLSPNLRAVDIG